MRRERWLVIATLALLQIHAVVAASYVLGRDGGRAPAPIASPRPTPLVTAGPVLAAADDKAHLPAKGTLAAKLTSVMGTPGLGPSVAGIVMDARTGAVLFDGRSGKPMTPASTTKVVTAAAVLATVGPDARLVTKVVRDPAKNAIVLVGGGDPTLAGPGAGRRTGDAYPKPATLAQLAARTAAALKAANIRSVTLSYDASVFSGPATAPGWLPNYFTEGSVALISGLTMDEGRAKDGSLLPDPPRATATAFAGLLEKQGIKVAENIRPGRAAGGMAVIARVESPPVYALVERMLTLSDNVLAEALARHVAIKEGQPPTFTGAAKAIRAVLTRLKAEQGIELSDGSGLSRRNRITPAALARLLAIAVNQGDGSLHSLISGLPVAGFTGTLHDRYHRPRSAPGAGLVRAKTGTLNGVNTLAGITSTSSGRVLTFAFMADQVADPERAIAALDEMATIVSQS
ncbi:MAG: D-alanyl-D-alanine carboxypeptidase/D-alanyl-D-alanine-endopeptidase [Thermobispora sp.]|nr:D-alanyl-D-alanine carboxypeptidase/D-alanyl-D-alanine-endopeptidase [Thermobispora sp.]